MGSGCSTRVHTMPVESSRGRVPSRQRHKSISLFEEELGRVENLLADAVDEFQILREAATLQTQQSRALEESTSGGGLVKESSAARSISISFAPGDIMAISAGVQSLGPFDIVPIDKDSVLELVGREYQCYRLNVIPVHLSGLFEDCARLGRLSQFCSVRNCDPLYGNARLVPPNAQHYAFAYPLVGVAEEVARLTDYADTFGTFLSMGGFVYVDDVFDIVAVLVLRPQFGDYSLMGGRSNGATLRFSGPHRLFESTEATLLAENRLSRVVLPELKDTGAFFQVWLPPGYITVGHPCPHGGLALLYPDMELSRYFVVTSPLWDGATGSSTVTVAQQKGEECVIKLLYAYNVRIAGGDSDGCFVRMWLANAEDVSKNGLECGTNNDDPHVPNLDVSGASSYVPETLAPSASTPSVSWPPKYGTRDPVWNSARAVGTVSHDVPQMLCVEVFAVKSGNKKRLTRIDAQAIPTSELWLNCPTPLYFSRGEEECRMLIQPTPMQRTQRKNVYFVRHGQSEWNKAQRSLANPRSLGIMLTLRDHGLSVAGVEQAEKLCAAVQKELMGSALTGSFTSRIKTWRSGSNTPATSTTLSEQDFLQSRQVVCSPLTRAVQTALIGLQPLLGREGRSVILSPNVREKRNFGGRDTSGTAYVGSTEVRIRNAVHELYPDNPARVTDLLAVVFDNSEVQGHWWSDQSETKRSVHERIEETFHQIQYMPAESVIIVGHSHWFREVFRMCLSEEFAEKNPTLVGNLGKYVMQNCGVVGCTLDFDGFRRGSGNCKLITDVKFLFDSKLVMKEKKKSNLSPLKGDVVVAAPDEDEDDSEPEVEIDGQAPVEDDDASNSM
eukprot:PhM_4_TR15341/c0_g1_i1/m.94665